MRPLVLSILCGTLLSGCFDKERHHVAGPFYLTYPESREDMALFRCFRDEGNFSCVLDFMPDAEIFLAGGDNEYIVLARHPREGGLTDKENVEYYYFKRTPQESRGWGNNPEKVLGPFGKNEFDKRKMELNLPDFSVNIES